MSGLAAATGCWPSALPPPPPPTKAYKNLTLTIACPHAAFAGAIMRRAAVWTAHTAGQVNVVARPLHEVPDADVAVVRAVESGALAYSGEARSVPAALMDAEHPCKWNGLLDTYKTKLIQWGSTPFALPLTGDGFVIIYRADLFTDAARQRDYRERTGLPLEPPRVWEDVEKVGQYFLTSTGKPSLSPLPENANHLLALFNQIAACYDRKAASFSDLTGPKERLVAGPDERAVAASIRNFHMDTDHHGNRLLNLSFVAAANWIHATRTLRPGTPGDPLASLLAGRSILAMVPLSDLHRLPRTGPAGAIDPRFGLAPLPGTQTYFDESGKAKNAAGGRNYVPYHGSSSLAGVVLTRSPHADAAWDFLIDFVSPTGSAITLAHPDIGSGPFRTEHTDSGHWDHYGFDANRTQKLVEAMASFTPYTIVNPAIGLRTPDQEQRMAALVRAVRAAGTAEMTGPAALQQASQEWAKLDEKAGSQLQTWLKKSSGQD